jgi:hypothetical protein
LLPFFQLAVQKTHLSRCHLISPTYLSEPV